MARLTIVGREAPVPGGSSGRVGARRAKRGGARRLGPRPDMVAAWAVVMGLVLLCAAILSAHG